MIRIRSVAIIALLLLVAACAKHAPTGLEKTSYDAFSGRLLVVTASKRIQVEIDWKGTKAGGELRLTHPASGAIVDIAWQKQSMLWRDNQGNSAWQPMSLAQLESKGVILPPWALARIFADEYPATMVMEGDLTWKGEWQISSGLAALKVHWSSDRKRLELTSLQQGKKAVVLFDE